MADPLRLQKMRDIARRNGKAPGATEKRRENALSMKLWEKGHAALLGNTEARALAGRRRTATVLAHIPAEMRADYRMMVQAKGLTADEAAQIVLQQHAEDMARFRREIGGSR